FTFRPVIVGKIALTSRDWARRNAQRRTGTAEMLTAPARCRIMAIRLMITDKLIPRLQQRFPDRPMKSGKPPEAIAVFAAAHPDVGDIQIFDDGSEVTLVAGKFTHGHFSDFNSKSADEVEENVVESVIEFLERLFADQVVLWGSHRGGGGWYDRNRGQSGLA